MRVFRPAVPVRKVGLTPAQYRRRFGVLSRRLAGIATPRRAGAGLALSGRHPVIPDSEPGRAFVLVR